ncbi:MAG: carbohydrate ABC transporter permease [Lachnospiraceae bacterium]|nr:carbohydrate ABC transporter permease [Lachnospiraceae bacterium]
MAKRRWDSVQIFSAVSLTLIALVIFVPFWNAVVISFETADAYAKHPFSWWPKEFTLGNYKYLLGKGSTLFEAYKGTIIVTVFGTLCEMAISVMAGYAYSRQFPGKRFFFVLLLITMFFGGGLVPTYLHYKNLGLLGTYASVILISLVDVQKIIIMKSSFESIPMELQEAAMIDGATDMTVFAKVMLPLQKPMIATFTLRTMVAFWNTWYWPTLLLNGTNKTVLQLYLKSFVSNLDEEVQASTVFVEGTQFAQGIKMAAVFIVMLPIMAVYPFLQKYFTKGIMVGAVKM